MFFFIPLFFGCQTKVKTEANQTPRVCPRCHNASLLPGKKSTWFELFFIPVIPLSRKHILICTICQWQAAVVQDDRTSTSAGAANNRSAPQLRTAQGWNPPNQPGYQPAYFQTQK